MKYILLSGGIGFLAGAVNSLLGTGGGILLVFLLGACGLQKKEIFSYSVAVMLPVSILTLILTGSPEVLSDPLLPCYLLGSAAGGYAAGKQPLPVKWLHRSFGLLMLLGGIRSLC